MDEMNHQRGSARMFKNPLLEKLSRVHPVTPAILYTPVVVAAVYVAAALYGHSALTITWQFAAGWFMWTLSEYWLHRLVFHLPIKSKITERIYFYMHGVHHDWPWDPARLVIPPGASLLLVAGCYGAFRWLLGAEFMYSAFAGFISGYVVYDSVHWYTHVGKSKNRWLKELRELHMRHHFEDPSMGFGVSCPWWDIVFRTQLSR